MLTERPEELLADPEVKAKLAGLDDAGAAAPPAGPDRAALLRLIDA